MKGQAVFRGGLGAVLLGLLLNAPGVAAPDPGPLPTTQPATAPASQPAAGTPHMWNFVHASVLNGQLMLVPASSDPVNIPTAISVVGVAGKVSVRGGGTTGQLLIQHIAEENGKQLLQSARIGPTNIYIGHVLTDTTTNVTEGINFVEVLSAAGGGATTAPSQRAALGVSTREKTVVDGQPKYVTKSVAKVEAATFAELCAKYPDEVKKYLEPVLRDLDLGGVFFLDLPDARHAFAEKLPPDPAVVAKVHGILPRLDDESQDVRAAALAELTALGDAAIAPLQALDLAKQPMQIRITLKTHLANAKGVGAGTEDPRLSDVSFLLLCLTLDDQQIPALAKAKLEKLRGKPVDVNLAAPVEERRTVVRKMLLEEWAGGTK